MPLNEDFRDTCYQIDRAIMNAAMSSPQYAIAYALIRLAEAQEKTAYQIQYLGNGNAATHMGAIENLSVQIKEGFEQAAITIAAAMEREQDRDTF